ncbi:MAG: DinB family protein [Bacteroidetes bacterium]|nr:DinB family protein [Bacteroidota bacterium]
MKELLLQMARYNLWANKRLIDVMLKLDEEELDKEIVSSFSSIRSTVYHTWGAEFIWLQRLELTEQPVWIAKTFKGTFDEACGEWQRVSQAFIDFIERQYDDKALEHVFQYYNTEKKSFKSPVHEVLQHVFNHSTYHRGQLVTLLRQLGADKLPQLDLIAFVRR